MSGTQQRQSAGTVDAAARRRASLALETSEFRRQGHLLVEAIADLLEGVAAQRVAPEGSPADIRAAIDAPRALPEHGSDPEALLSSAVALLRRHSVFNGHPRFFGYITASPAHIGILGEFLAAAVNPNVVAWRLSPIATEIEAQTIRWIAELIGYPADCGGLFVSGGNMANIVSLVTARTAAATWDVRAAGLAAPDARRLRIYASTETHTWIQKAADLAGVGTSSIRWIPTTPDLRADPAQLRAMLAHDTAAGDLPLLVVGTAGSVSTGAVDPLFEMAEICREYNAWFHVDGAYGAFAAAVTGAPADLQAIHLADSVAVDPHKWLYAPIEAGCVLVREAKHLRNAFSYHPPYYHFGEASNYVDFGPQNTRGFRALKVWLGLQHAGRNGYVNMIEDDIRLSQRLHERVAANDELEPWTQSLSITTFRFVPRDLRDRANSTDIAAYLDRLNQVLLDRIQGSGEAFVSNAVVDGRYLLRACIVNFNTNAADIDELPGIVAGLGRRIDAELRGTGT